MKYAVYVNDDSGDELWIMNEKEVQQMMKDFLIDEAEIEEDFFSKLNFVQLVNLFKDTAEETVRIKRILIVNERDQVLVDI